MTSLRKLLERAAAGEDVDRLMAEHAAERRVTRARDRLAQAIRDDDDPTGQDNERAIDAAADDYIHAQDMRLRALSPDAYEERRQMGLLE